MRFLIHIMITQKTYVSTPFTLTYPTLALLNDLGHTLYTPVRHQLLLDTMIHQEILVFLSFRQSVLFHRRLPWSSRIEITPSNWAMYALLKYKKVG